MGYFDRSRVYFFKFISSSYKRGSRRTWWYVFFSLFFITLLRFIYNYIDHEYGDSEYDQLAPIIGFDDGCVYNQPTIESLCHRTFRTHVTRLFCVCHELLESITTWISTTKAAIDCPLLASPITTCWW